MKHQDMPLPAVSRRRRSGFTLVEIMVASAITLVVITAVFSIVLAVTKSTRKAEFLAEALTNTREVQEFLKREISSAIKKDSIANGLGLSFELGNGSGRYARLSYRVPVGNPLSVAGDTSKTSDQLVLEVPAGVSVAVGDYVVISVPNTGDRLRVVAVTDPGPGSSREVTVTLSKKIEDATEGEKLDLDVEPDRKLYVSVYRDRKFEVVDPGAAAVASLRWWENSSDDTTARTLSTQVAASGRHMFEPIPDDLGATKPELEHAVRWHFIYQGTNPVAGMLPGSEPFWNRNETEGVLWARSGDPENYTGYSRIDDKESTIPSTTTSTSSIKTTATTKPSTTSTKKPSTTSTKAPSTTSTKKPTTTSTKKPTTTSTSKPSTKPPTSLQDG
ncbi:MAG: prepilin-type N-terminal cleavage/methylation domain-containing protein [Opitutaceae bacterium]